MGFSAYTPVLTVDGLKYLCKLGPDDRVVTPTGSSRVTFCGYYDYSGAASKPQAMNIDCHVVVVGSHLMQSWLNRWLHLRHPYEDVRIAGAYPNSAGTDGEPALGKPLVRDELICYCGHAPYVHIPYEVAPDREWVFGTENGLASVGPFIARTLKVPDGWSWDHQNLGPDRPLHLEYLPTTWEYKDHQELQAVVALYFLAHANPVRPDRWAA